MNDSAYLIDTYLPDLGRGSATAMWGFRACALGHARCCCLIRGFEEIFGKDAAGPVLSELLELARILGNEGRRKVKLAMPGCARITYDEASFLSAISAAQSSDLALRDAHLSWLLAMSASQDASNHASRLGGYFLAHGMPVCAPECETVPPARETLNLANMRIVGTA